MKIKHCEHCNRVYQPEPKGLMAVLCRRCKDDCNQAYFKLHRIVRHVEQQGLEAMALDMEWMANEAQIPSLFALLLFKEGYFTIERHGRVDVTGDQCKKCEKKLGAGQKRYCDRCSQLISSQLRNAITESRLFEDPPDDPPRDHKYGLGGHRSS